MIRLAESQPDWSIDSWTRRPVFQPIAYANDDVLAETVRRLRSLPPLVTSWEIERLKSLLAEAQEGKRFLLQGGDCAESLDECHPVAITNKLKILLQMSLVLVFGGKRPVIRVGRLAGQYAKPRSSATETRDGVTLPSYFGDLVNRAPFHAEARAFDPEQMLRAYHASALTLNFVRALTAGGFADLHHPEYWDLSFFQHTDLRPDVRTEYERICNHIAEALRFMDVVGESSANDIHRVELFTSHEGLNLYYESSQTRVVPRRSGYYNLSTHLPWIGERTRDMTGAHIEYFRGIENPIGVKLGPSTQVDELVRLCKVLNPRNEPGKILLITRMGALRVQSVLPRLIEAVRGAGLRVLWVCDPMHGNTQSTSLGIKTRRFDDIMTELERTFTVHEQAGSWLGGIHIELTGEDVTECVGGASGVQESDLNKNYGSLCDPRLNYAQALELSLLVARHLAKSAPSFRVRRSTT